MKPLVQRLKEQGFRIVVVDVDAEPQKAEKAGITGIPTFVHHYNGKVTQTKSGSVSAFELRTMYRPQPNSSSAW